MTLHRKIAVRMAASLLAAAIIGTGTALSEQSARAIPVHHDDDAETPAAPDAVTHLMRLANEACFLRGDDSANLGLWAETQHWTAMPATELAAHDNAYTILVGGWTVENEFGAFALILSRMKAPQEGHVCSLTAKPVSVEQHIVSKKAFEKQFDTVIADEVDRPSHHTDRYWLERNERPPVKATMIHTRALNVLTIRMIHGGHRPLRS